MSSSFLLGFSEALVTRLVAEGLLEVVPEGQARVKLYLANHLGTVARGGSLLSNVEAALIACHEVEELYADLETLKVVVEDLKT